MARTTRLLAAGLQTKQTVPVRPGHDGPSDREELLERLRAMGRDEKTGGAIEVALDELRSGNDPTGERIVRSLGAELGRAGAIVRA